ncbi:MAG: serine/threonine protein kinase [Deltaproteobacteria bacterium]|nr:serine/threonine protein kinase [Deltaproteobacteria bacterium]
MSAPAPLPIEQVGPYRVLRAIGAGGSARIDLARIDRAYGFQRHVVIKRPLEHLREDPNVAASLHREARIGGRLRHPNLVAVLDAGVHDRYDYLVLEYIHGTSLRGLMQTDDPHVVREVPLATIIAIAVDIARGLHAAHELLDETGAPLGLVHRDISPGNVLLALDGSVKVSDFGIAKETRVSTLSGSMHGTVTYMAPEQCRGHAFDRRADIFSLGVILHELLTHRRLFLADNDVASLHRVLSGEVPRPGALVPSVPAALDDIVMTAVASDPGARYATARELADALEAFAAREGIVFGARLVARSVENVAGARQAPWIASTTVVDPPRRAEPSLVAVIESLEAEPGEEIGVQFGPSDPRTLEEGEVPSSPAETRPMPARRPPWRRRPAPWAIVTAVVGIVIAVGATQSHHHGRTVHVQAPPAVSPSAPAPMPAAEIAPTPTASEPARAAAPTPVAEPGPVAEPTPAPPAEPAPARAAIPPKKSTHHSTRGAAAGSNVQAVAPPAPVPSPEPTGSARPPARVEWNPTMLLPSDKPK